MTPVPRRRGTNVASRGATKKKDAVWKNEEGEHVVVECVICLKKSRGLDGIRLRSRL